MVTFSDYFAAYWHLWLTEGLVISGLLAILFLNWKRIAKATISHMLQAAVIIWTAGTVLYSIGFAYEGSGQGLTFFFRAALASLGMFISDNELIEVSHHYKEDAVYMAFFALVHLSAVFLSAIVILNTVGFRLKHFFLLMVETLRSKKKDEDTYIFWGFSEQSVTLAIDIRKKYPDARIIFVRSTGESNMGERLEVPELMNAGAGASNSIKIVKSVSKVEDAIVFYISMENLENGKLGRLRTLIEHATNLNFFFFTPDEGVNIKLGALVYADDSISSAPHKNVGIYTMATLGGKNRILENHIVLQRQKGKRASWKFVDQSFLSVTALKRRFDIQPVHAIPSANIRNGAVDGEFTALILGFGGTGQEMYKYLYEFGSFVRPDGTESPKKIIIVDKDIDRIAGPMCISNPSVFHTDSVKMLSCNPGTVEFWRAIQKYASTINCISIALGSDETDVSITMDIYRAIMQYSTVKPENIKIFLRIYSPENEHSIRSLAADYNQYKEEAGIEIVPFGSISEVFTTDVLLAADQLKAARKFNYNFDLLRGRNKDLDENQAWAKDYNVADFIAKYKAVPLALEELTRRIVQCHADSLHIGTILALAGVDLQDKERLSGFVELGKSREIGSRKYASADEKTQELMDNLARSVQTRVNSLHWILGYRYADEASVQTDPVLASMKKLTSNMKPWDECTEEEKLMAYTVVDTSFVIALEMLP